MSIWEAVLLGVVEGLTEYLPISSTGHLILVSTLLGRADDPAVKSFQIVIQVGAILAVLGLYQDRAVSMVRGVLGVDPAGRRLLGHLVVGFLPAGLLGLTIHSAIKSYLFWWGPVAFALAAGGVAILFFEPLRKRRAADGRTVDEMTWRDALTIGVAQCVAMWPGTSRSLATILGGLGTGLRPAAAAEFSFLLALPTLGGATVLDLIKDGDALLAGVSAASLAAGVLTSLAAAALAIRAFVGWLSHHGLAPFGVYRLILAPVFAAAWLLMR